MCWPFTENSQRKVEGMRSSLNVSASASRANKPRRFTQAPRLVDTVTSGEAVTMRSVNGNLCRPSSLRMAPNPFWVDIIGWIETTSSAGTATEGALSRRGPRAANGTCLRNASMRPAGSARPSNFSHSWPGRIAMAARNFSICAGVMSPAWLSLCPANGSPTPLIV